MHLNRILAALDESEAGRQAVRTAFEIGRRSSSRVTLLHVVAARAIAALPGVASSLALDDDTPSTEHFRRWVDERVAPPQGTVQAELSISYGVPGIEICRFAEETRADLIVLGRKQHCERSRLLLGDTGDAVARRSRVPCLFVPPEEAELRRILVALDGSSRGMSVLEHACDLAGAVGATLHVVTVERGPLSQPIAVHRTAFTQGTSLQDRVSECLISKGLPNMAVTTRSGRVADEVLAEVNESGCDVLAIGHHRGGQPWAVQAGSTAQRLSHAAPCAVLTIPL